MSCPFAKESVISGSGYNRWKVPPASISTHAAGSHGATLSTVPGQMKSYHKRGVVRGNFLERRGASGMIYRLNGDSMGAAFLKPCLSEAFVLVLALTKAVSNIACAAGNHWRSALKRCLEKDE